MAYISGINREQTMLISFDDFIGEDNKVRMIDCFVNHLDLDKLGFILYDPNSPGQKPYKTSDLLKLHIYGYTEGIRSSRKLATEASRNIELMWLLNSVTPEKSCIADFVKNNKSALKQTFKNFVAFLKYADFVDGKINVIDGSKIRAQNSKNKYYSIKKIDATIDFFNSQINKYLDSLSSLESSQDSDPDAIINIKSKIDNYKQKVEDYNKLKKTMSDDNLNQITLTDPDSRMMTSHGNSYISYNLQTAVDSKNSLIIACDVVNDINDTCQLENMTNKAIDNLDETPENTIADMGYFNTDQISNCEKLNTKVFVKQPKTKNATNNPSFSSDKFKYIKEKNIYLCPMGKELHFCRFLKKKKSKEDVESSIVGSEYLCTSCGDCTMLNECTTSVNGRRITRNANQDIIDLIQDRFTNNPQMYTIRKCVVEHPFGTIKRSMNCTYFLRKGLESVQTEAALICLAYDFKRLTKLTNYNDFKKKLEDFFLYYHNNYKVFLSYFICYYIFSLIYMKKLMNMYNS